MANHIESALILSDWTEEIQQSLVKTNAFCIAVFTLDGNLLFSNEAFQLLTKKDPIESFVNPTFSELCQLSKEINPIFTGVLTLGDYYAINTSIEAKVYFKNQQLLVTGGVDVSQLLEYNMLMHRLNRENTNMQRELIKKTRTIEKMIDDLNTTNDELEKVNLEYQVTNEELIHSNNEVTLLNGRLSVYNQQLEELNATKDKFFSIIAHDLRNPFNSLLGYSDLLKRNAANYKADEIADFANEMADAAKVAYQLVENLLEWSRIQRGILTPEKEWLSVQEILNEIKLLSAKQAQPKNIHLSFDADNSLMVFADKQMTRATLRNLVTNAIKFTNDNGTITIRVKDETTETRFSVIDNGLGIEKEHLDKLFRIDSKLNRIGTKGEPGTGLGLILCKEFIDIQAGKIWVVSSPGIGSEFHFTLPTPKKNKKKKV